MKKEEVARICRKKREMMRRKVEEIWRQNTMKEYMKFIKYTKNLTKEYHPRNLNGQLLSEKKSVMDGRHIFKEIKRSGSIKHRTWYGRSWF